ncbi:hypothetical protein [Komagataeibacter sp. FNDCR2]|uniref:hypothetical protein n=1 Tax=Komagataeibacter sp. FNDCR2 TaxID=2878682 RepID=UPI001E28776F|nr:hypothetical protein [Komagataeibacter sp. FNDCR2]MCE2574363.1 hypothetical protein [Komagataeibacter sp. FNDCR2]
MPYAPARRVMAALFLAGLFLAGLGGCDDPLLASRTPPAQDCARRDGMWQVTPDGHTGLCHLPPGSRIAGWTIVPRAHGGTR